MHPALHHRRKPESGLRRHDGYSYSVTHRRTLPVPQLPCAMASICRCYAARHAEIALSKTAAETPCRLQSSIHHRIPRPAHHSHAPPRRQIAIDGHRPRRPPRVPSLKAFGRRPSTPVHRPRRAGIRNPAQYGNLTSERLTSCSMPLAGSAVRTASEPRTASGSSWSTTRRSTGRARRPRQLSSKPARRPGSTSKSRRRRLRSISLPTWRIQIFRRSSPLISKCPRRL